MQTSTAAGQPTIAHPMGDPALGSIVICALYRFVGLPDYQELQPRILDKMRELDIRGSLLIAAEGINGTISGSDAGLTALLAWFDTMPRFEGITTKFSRTNEQPFHRTKVKLKREIVTMGIEDIDPTSVVGRYVEPKDWNALISDPEVLLLDTRNMYEVRVGTFEGAVDPEIDTFREFPAYVDQNLDPKKHKKVAMFCTGGIRCEKSTGYLLKHGFEEVFHLKGGILKYLEEVPTADTMWNGECFVFDERVTVNHDLERGQYDVCRGCREPVDAADKQHADYEEGVRCHRCAPTMSPERLARLRMRHKQVLLAEKRGEAHIGDDAQAVFTKHRAEKFAEKDRQRAVSKAS